MEGESLKEALEIASGSKNTCCARCRRTVRGDGVVRDLGCRPIQHHGTCELPSRTRGRPPLADQELLEEIKSIIDDMPTYGYRRVHAILRRKACSENRPWPNAKRVYRVMKVHSMLLQRHTGAIDTRRHDGRVSVEQSNLRWCSDGVEIGCDNKEKVRVAFALDCCDREAIAHVATTEGIKSEDVQGIVITAVENRFGLVNTLPKPVEWLTDNGSCFIAKDTRSLLIDIGMEP